MSRIRGVIFDLDGTLFDSHYDWREIKRRLGVTRADGSILDYLATLPADQARVKTGWLEAYEDRATRRGTLRPGARRLLGELRDEGIKLALVTNNRAANARQVIERYALAFDAVVTRDDGHHKPSPEPMRHAGRRLGLEPSELAAVGDNAFDVEAARGARLGLVLTVNATAETPADRSDLSLPDLHQLGPLLRDAIRRES